MNKQYELLSPAGDMERLLMALHYGADAVYLAGESFGMRAAAGNFSDEELFRAINLCHEKGVKAYVTCNTLPREAELARLGSFLSFLNDAGADAVIAADLGVIAAVKKYAPNCSIHASTQMGVTNSAACKALWDMGVKRAVLARELSLEEIAAIRKNIPAEMELEAFVHGAMCVSFSGRCLLSNYMTDRDANRGECAQPCRWKYHLVEEKRPGEYFEIFEDGGSYILNSRDLRMIEHLPLLMEAGITSFKIEGRMKSAYYCACATNAYRHALDDAVAGRPLDPVWLRETEMLSHREYSTGFYFGPASQHYSRSDSIYFAGADICAVVERCDENGRALLSQRNKFSVGDTVELMTNGGPPVAFTVERMEDSEGQFIVSAPHPMMELELSLPVSCSPLSVLRKLK
jgi:putative protease